MGPTIRLAEAALVELQKGEDAVRQRDDAGTPAVLGGPAYTLYMRAVVSLLRSHRRSVSSQTRSS